jgi:RND family efflux transporter MFP subunit
VALTATQKQQLAYYEIRAPFSGIVGDVPVHVGDYVSPTTVLTTVDENADLEAYIYIPTERATGSMGLPVEILDNDGAVLAKSTISFLSPQVDNGLQSILAKAEIPKSQQMLRNFATGECASYLEHSAEANSSGACGRRVGGQPFVFVAAAKGDGYTAHQVAVTLGETVGNTYPVLSGLKPGDKVILSACSSCKRARRLSRLVDFFIRRPIFATVCALLIVLAGAVCIPTLPISLYPSWRRRRSWSPATTSARTQRTSSPPSPSSSSSRSTASRACAT